MILWVICENVHSFDRGSCVFLSFSNQNLLYTKLLVALKIVIKQVT